MDFSQLPKMSNTPASQQQQEQPTAQQAGPASPPPPHDGPAPIGAHPVYVYAAPPPSLASVWVSLIVGLICLMLGWNFVRWALLKMNGEEMNTGWLQPDGVTPVRYFELAGGTAWTELAFFIMGVALLLDAALILAAARRATPNHTLVLIAVVVTGAALLLNVGLAGYLLTLGVMPIVSMILLLVGGFVLFDQLPLLKRR